MPTENPASPAENVGVAAAGYMEQINTSEEMLLPPDACGKYDVSRELAGGFTTGQKFTTVDTEDTEGIRLLDAA